jgi:hypothetical protein
MHYIWKRRGLLIPPPTGLPWAHSHAALPYVENEDEQHLSVYYSPRDEQGRAHVARARIAIDDRGLELLDTQPDPVLSPGARGAFDESGSTMSCLVHGEDADYLYYTGWTLGVTVPFYFYAGLAVRAHNETSFKRLSTAPLLERNPFDPFLTASPWVLRDGGIWRMWYVSCRGWTMIDGEPRHQYNLRYAESENGIDWRREGHVSVDFADAQEYAISRPCVVRDHDRYRMWFAARGSRYCLCYAESDDGLNWIRDDARAGLQPAQAGWDSEMIAYPAVLDRDGDRYLFYNGNDYGRTGIGYAVGAAHDRDAGAPLDH